MKFHGAYQKIAKQTFIYKDDFLFTKSIPEIKNGYVFHENLGFKFLTIPERRLNSNGPNNKIQEKLQNTLSKWK